MIKRGLQIAGKFFRNWLSLRWKNLLTLLVNEYSLLFSIKAQSWSLILNQMDHSSPSKLKFQFSTIFLTVPRSSIRFLFVRLLG